MPASPPKPLQLYQGAATVFNLDKSSSANAGTNYVCLFSKCDFRLLDICRFLRPELEIAPFSGTMKHSCERWLRGTTLLLLLRAAVSVVMLPNNTGWDRILDKYLDEEGDWWEAKQRGKRAISDSDAQLILDLHNKLRGQVYPPASNMEYMVSGRIDPRRALFTLRTVFAKLFDPTLNPRIVLHTCGPQLVQLAQTLASMEAHAHNAPSLWLKIPATCQRSHYYCICFKPAR